MNPQTPDPINPDPLAPKPFDQPPTVISPSNGPSPSPVSSTSVPAPPPQPVATPEDSQSESFQASVPPASVAVPSAPAPIPSPSVSAPNSMPQPSVTSQPFGPASNPNPSPIPTQPVVSSPSQPVVGGEPAALNAAPAVDIQIKQRRRLRPNKTFLTALAAFLVIGGASAFAYFGVVLPNKPENVLKASVANSLQQEQVKFKAQFDIAPVKSGEGFAVKAAADGASDTTKKAYSSIIKVTVSGVTVEAEVRYVDNALYIKVSDLKNVVGLVKNFSPEYAKTIQTLNKQIADQWIVFDETLIKQAGGSCALDADWKFTDADLQIIQQQYANNPFATIKSVSSDTLDGQDVEKFVIDFNDNKGAQFAKGLNELSMIKALKKCSNEVKTDDLIPTDGDTTPITIWVNKSKKEIVQIKADSTAYDAEKANVKGSFTIKLDYGDVSISKPAGAKPFMEVFGGLMGTGSSSASMSTSF